MKPIRFFFSVLGVLLLLLVQRSAAASLDLIDEVGRRVTIPFPPRRIVSLAPNVTETLFALGLHDEIIGVSIHCNYPEEAKQKPRVGSYISVDFERILFLKPDLVVATGVGNTRDMVARLEKLGFAVYVIFPKNFDDILRSIAHVGQVVDRERKAREIVDSMKKRGQRVSDLTRDLRRPRVFLQIGERPLVSVGRGSFAHDLILRAGGENITGQDKEMYPRIGLEEVLRRSPEVILVSSMNPRGDYPRVLREWARWKTIPAARNGRIHLIDSDLIDRPSPRIIEGLEEIARILHPERFGT